MDRLLGAESAVVSPTKPHQSSGSPLADVNSASSFSDSVNTATTESRPVSRPAKSSEFATENEDKALELPDFNRSGHEILRRLSLIDRPPVDLANMDPKARFSTLGLTGNVISASICIPYQLRYRPGHEWDLNSRRGTSALFDNFSHLSSDRSPWNHTMVGWTGEISPAPDHDFCVREQTTPITQKPQLSRTYTDKTISQNPQSIKPDVKHTPRYSTENYPRRSETPHHFNTTTDTLVVSQADRARLEKQLSNGTNGKTLPVWLGELGEEPDTNLYLKDQGRWRRYAEHELYTLFHYRQHAPDDGRAEQKSWADMVRLNQAFADRILNVYQPGDIIWIHDYHLILLPSILRQRIPHAYIGFFLHIPFPSSEYLRMLPRRTEVLTGALGASMVGFQSYSFARHFNSCCQRILGFESSSAGVDAFGAHVSVDVFPIGIDVSTVQKAAFQDPAIDEKIAELKARYAGKKVVVGRDRLDTVRGVAQKLEAFEVFLQRYPEWRDKVVLIQVTSPTSVQEEKEDSKHSIENKVSALVGRINGAYGSLSYNPVQHYTQYLSSMEYFALLRMADVALITSVRDGMNTTSLEFVIAQRDHHGPLILSEFSGTAASLGNAMHINPWNLGQVADTLKEALELPFEEKKKSHQKLYDHVKTHTVEAWSNLYLNRLLTNLTSFSQSELTPALDVEQLKYQYHIAKKRLFMFDYDGTLTPIVKDPNAALPSDKVHRTLKSLAADPKNQVWIISGRDEKFLGKYMGVTIPELGLSAEHGCFMRAPGSGEWKNLTTEMDMGWQSEVMDVFDQYTERTPGSWVEKKRVALTWHYRQVDPEFGAWQAQECKKVLEAGILKNWEVEVMSGKANLEVRPRFVNKGFIANRLVHECGLDKGDPPDFIFCLGDDQTDEDMFRALLKLDLPAEHVFSCTVGASSKRTLAKWHVLDPKDVVAANIELLKPYTRRSDDPNNVPVKMENKA